MKFREKNKVDILFRFYSCKLTLCKTELELSIFSFNTNSLNIGKIMKWFVPDFFSIWLILHLLTLQYLIVIIFNLILIYLPFLVSIKCCLFFIISWSFIRFLYDFEASEPKWVISIFNIIWVNSHTLGRRPPFISGI